MGASNTLKRPPEYRRHDENKFANRTQYFYTFGPITEPIKSSILMLTHVLDVRM